MTETTAIDGRHAKSAATLSKLIDAWVSVVGAGQRPTRERVMAVANVSRASYTRLTSTKELAVLGTERQLANLAEPVTTVSALAGTIRQRVGALITAASRLDIDEAAALDRIDALSAELRRLWAVRAKWEAIR